ncbi:uncharacterized protein G6M90_00g039640 [Metarhizium brunneum]|uniref:Uncharacterized protein n=1 Tax=Metarhizium brunneum TaxID=500148 RepID=A0A7D5YZ82_9HYPO|nr:hypothetical protein G6M90_00g039640 [Metarhizium brunneum]
MIIGSAAIFTANQTSDPCFYNAEGDVAFHFTRVGTLSDGQPRNPCFMIARQDRQHHWYWTVERLPKAAVPFVVEASSLPARPGRPVRVARNEDLTHAKKIACDQPGAQFGAQSTFFGTA